MEQNLIELFQYSSQDKLDLQELDEEIRVTGVTTLSREEIAKKKKHKDTPDPNFLAGKRVEHEFLISREGSKRRRRLVYTGTVKKIVRRAKDPLYTLYSIEYDVDNISSDTDSDDNDEEPLTECNYELLIDYINGDLKVID